jgi:hypothetical protein
MKSFGETSGGESNGNGLWVVSQFRLSTQLMNLTRSTLAISGTLHPGEAASHFVTTLTKIPPNTLGSGYRPSLPDEPTFPSTLSP